MRPATIRNGLPLAALLALVPAAAEACAVCFGAADSKLTEGMNAGILALLGFVVLVQAGFIALFLRFRHRSKKLAERRDSLHLI
ncbi:MAG: hypothetical protein GY953_31350 [bacterium]|nr:hypothetical protein [bacterium]